jgi:hypothetical protein
MDNSWLFNLLCTMRRRLREAMLRLRSYRDQPWQAVVLGTGKRSIRHLHVTRAVMAMVF